jgi:hypothetical protein
VHQRRQPQAAALGVDITRGKLASSLKNVASRMLSPVAATKYRNVDSVASFCIKNFYSWWNDGIVCR